jgi:hypothetical protein
MRQRFNPHTVEVRLHYCFFIVVCIMPVQIFVNIAGARAREAGAPGCTQAAAGAAGPRGHRGTQTSRAAGHRKVQGRAAGPDLGPAPHLAHQQRQRSDAGGISAHLARCARRGDGGCGSSASGGGARAAGLRTSAAVCRGRCTPSGESLLALAATSRRCSQPDFINIFCL